MAYDIIGDIHGCGDTLEALLTKLGYAVNDGVYKHPSRKVIFLGDFIDGDIDDDGSLQRKVIDIVKPMIESGAALSVMGNHEYNAIAYATEHNGEYLRKHTPDNIKQHKAFLKAYDINSKDYKDVTGWFKDLPLWLELEDINVIHACWDMECINKIKNEYSDTNVLTEDLILKSSDKEKDEYIHIETILKGKEIEFINGYSFTDQYDKKRKNMRVRWWDTSSSNYKDAFLGDPEVKKNIDPHEIPKDLRNKSLIGYSSDAPALFLGHYWMNGTPEPLASNIACLDYSVAKKGKLVAYRWDGNRILSKNNFVFVERIEPITEKKGV